MAKKKTSPPPAATAKPLEPPHTAACEQSIAMPSRRWRAIVSSLIAIQLLVVTAEPLRFFTRSNRGTSPITDPARRLLAPAVEFGYLNHGYFFFAPEPGPSHLLEFRFRNSEDRASHIRFPDRQAQWPRLLYHRHFMLTENLNQLWAPPVDPNLPPDDPFAMEWTADRSRYETIRDSMANHVATRYKAQSEVVVDRIRHDLPSIEDVIVRRLRLNDRQFYVTLPDAPQAGAPPLNANQELPLEPGISPAETVPAQAEAAR